MGQLNESLAATTNSVYVLDGLSHEIFGPVFLPVWIVLGLNMNRFWFLSFKEAPSILDRQFKF
jgi:hypothetical protein